MADVPHRRSSGTRAAAQRVALERFTADGYDATSLREIAEDLGVTKAALYHHFRSKEDIVAALLVDRADAADDLLAWIRMQPRDDALPRCAVLRWIDGIGSERLLGVRFAAANPGLLGRVGADAGRRMATAFAAIVDELVRPDAGDGDRLRLRMAFLAVESALAAARGMPMDDAVVLAAARTAAMRLLGG